MAKRPAVHPLSRVRKTLGLNQKEFAAGIGITAAYVGQIELGDRRLNEDIIRKVWEVYKIPPNELMDIGFDGPEAEISKEIRQLKPEQKAAVEQMIKALKGQKAKV